MCVNSGYVGERFHLSWSLSPCIGQEDREGVMATARDRTLSVWMATSKTSQAIIAPKWPQTVCEQAWLCFSKTIFIHTATWISHSLVSQNIFLLLTFFLQWLKMWKWFLDSVSFTNAGYLLDSGHRLIPRWCSCYLPWGVSADIFQKVMLLTCFSFSLWPIVCCSILGVQEYSSWASWEYWWPLKVKSSSGMNILGGPPAAGTQGCLHVWVRKILMGNKMISSRWESRA